MITIAGGTGRVGARVVRTLLANGEDVRVLTRDPEAARARLGDGPRLARVDYEDSRTLRDAFANSERALIAAGTRDATALIDAAAAVGVMQVVELSSGPRSALEHEQRLDWTLLRPAPFTDQILDVARGMIRAGAFGGHAGLGRASLIDARDVAAVAAKVLRQGPAPHAGKTYELTGPEAITMHDVADLLGHVYVDRTREEQRATLQELGLPAPRIEALLGLDDRFREEVHASPTLTVQAIIGRPATPIEDFAGTLHALAASG